MSITKFEEQLTGYSLVKRIGAGGYGEVWKAEAPGGLAKAVKFVYGFLGEERASRELKALQRVKEVRHPFLLSLERIEILDGQLVIVTELADSSLKERFQECRDAGLPGIPRKELLNHLRDTAEALDYMSESFSLQHLDIKPENLLMLGGRIKVADFGLVKEIENVTVSMMGGMTPVYAAPELFDGRPSLQSDQYSLAIVYQEMLSGVLPFPGKTNSQLTNQHLHSQPQLTPLPQADRPIIAKSLAKDPKQRYPNCRAMVDGLFAVDASRQDGEISPPSTKSQSHRNSTINVTQVCDTKSQPAAKALGEDNRTIPSDLLENGELCDSVESRVESLAIDISQSLQEILAGSDRPSASSRERESTTSADAWLEAVDESACKAQPPLKITTPTTLRPVLVIGLGGAGGRVVRKLQTQIRDRWENDLPAVRLLHLDADSQSLVGATSADAGDLPACSKLLVSLQRLEKYHDDTPNLLRWLDRRWLYNLPRSGRPEGLRPLGRLAYVDHADEIKLRIRATIEQMIATESREITSQLIGLSVSSVEPEIYLISSLGGGTGSGMIHDLACGVRDVLDEMGIKAAAIRAILTFSTPRHPDEKKLALANAHAALRELRYYSSHYRPSHNPAEEISSPDPATDTGKLFDDVHCIDWGENLDDNQFDDAAERTADYVLVNTVSAQRAFFHACLAADATSLPGVNTCGINRIACTRKNLPQPWVDYICRKVVDEWRGCAKNKKLLKPALSQSYDFADLLTRTSEQIGSALDVLDESAFCIALEQAFSESSLRDGVTMHLTSRQVFQTIDTLVGSVRTIANWNSAPEHPLQKSLFEKLCLMARDAGRRLLDDVLQTSGPLPGGCAAAQAEIGKYLAEIAQKDDQNRRQQDSLREFLAKSEHVLSTQTAILSASKKPWWRLKSADQVHLGLAPCWLEHAKCRRDLMLLQMQGFMLQAMKADLCAMNDKLRNLQNDLQRLAEQFPEETMPEAEDDPSAMDEQLREKAPELIRLCAELCRNIAIMQSGDAMSLKDEAFHLIAAAADKIRHIGEEALLSFLRLGMMQTWIDDAASGSNQSWAEIFTAAKPILHDCGGNARMLISAPEQLLKSLRQSCITTTGIDPTLMPSTEEQILVCYQIDNLSLPRVAIHCLKGERDLTSLARRLQTRNDIAWSLQ